MKLIQAFSITLLFMLASARGQAWESIRPPGTYTYFSSTLDSLGVVTVIGDGGTYWSADGGRKWTGESPSQFTKSTVVFNYNGTKIANAGMVRLGAGQDFVAFPNGDLYCVGVLNLSTLTVFRSTDHGFTWNNTMDSLPEFATVRFGKSENLIATPNGNLFLFIPGAASKTDLYVSTDHGKTWQPKGNLVVYVACASDSAGQVYCSATEIPNSLSASLFQSQDTGSTWKKLVKMDLYFMVAANQRDRIAIAGSKYIAVKAPGDTGFTIGTPGVDINLGSDIAITPSDEIMAGTSKGIVRINKKLDGFETLNTGLKADSVIKSCKFQYDMQGNLYLHVNNGFYVMRNPNAALFPVRKIQTSMPGQIYFDLNGRKRMRNPLRVFPELGLIGVFDPLRAEMER